MVRGMRGVGGVCEMCMCLAQGVESGGEWIRGFGLGFTNPMGTGSVGVVLVGVSEGLVPGLVSVGWCFPDFPKSGKLAPIAGGGRFRHNLQTVYQNRCDRYTACRLFITNTTPHHK